MLDATLRFTFRNFATLFLVAAAVTVPLHVALTFVYRDVVAVSELHPAIDTFPPLRRVRGVGPPELAAARRAAVAVALAELALLVPAIGATRRVLAAPEGGRLPGVLDAWAHSLGSLRRRPPHPRAGVVELAAGVVVVAAAAYALRRIGAPLVEAVAPDVRFGPAGLLDGAVRAFAAPFVLVPLALFGPGAKDGSEGRPT